MPLAVNAVLTFVGYEVLDGGITLRLVAAAPGPGQPSDWYVFLSDAELSAVTTALQFQDLVIAKAQRKFRAANIASKLDPRIGSQITI